MDTATLQFTDGTTQEIPLVFAFDSAGQPTELVGDVTPEQCDHDGATWSTCLDMRCPRCGAKLILPPRFLARLPEETLEAMYQAWCAAGWPEFHGGPHAHWSIVPDKWTVIKHPLFAAVGGLPVRNERLAQLSAQPAEVVA